MSENGTTPATLEVRDLHASVEGKEILRGIDLVVRQGETHALMGPNGSGKSTLSNVIMGRPGYVVTSGQVIFNGEDISGLTADERAKRGLFLAMQYPTEVPGVSVVNFLRTAYQAVKGEQVSALAFRKHMKEQMDRLGIDDAMVNRYVNQGFSGGEKKRNEVLQLAVLEPEIAILDETDSGLDIDALRIVSDGVNALAGPGMGVLVITHYNRILNYIKPDRVHVMVDGSPLFRILDEDVDAALGETPAMVAEAAADNLRHALDELQEARDSRSLLRALGYSALATLLLVVVLGLLAGGILIALGHLAETRGSHLQVLARVLTGGGPTGVTRPRDQAGSIPAQAALFVFEAGTAGAGIVATDPGRGRR